MAKYTDRPFIVFREQSRRLQKTPLATLHVGAFPFPSYKEPQRAKSRQTAFFRRDTPQLDEYPETPARFFEGFYPAPFLITANRNEFRQKLAKLPERNVRPETPVGFFEGFFPGSAAVVTNISVFSRRLQHVPQLDERPETPARFFEGFHPAFGETTAKRSSFDRRLQHVLLDEYPAAAIPAVPYAALTPTEKANRSEFERKQRNVPRLDKYPETPVGFFEGFKPAFGDVFAHKSGFVQRLQIVPQLDEYPSTVPIPATLGAYLEKQSLKRRDIRRQLQTLELDEHPAAAAGIAPLSAFAEKQALLRRDIKRALQRTLELDQRPATPPAANITRPGLTPAFTVYVEESRKQQKLIHVPFTPASTIFEATRPSGYFNTTETQKDKRKAQPVVSLPDTPATPSQETISGYPGSAGVKAFRSAFKLTLQSAAYPDVYPTTAPPATQPYASYAVIPKAHKWFEIAAYLQLTNSLTVFKKTDPAYYAGWFPAPFKAELTHKHLKHGSSKAWFRRRHLRLVDPIGARLQPSVTAAVTSWQLPKQHVRHGKSRIQELPRLHTFPRIEPANEATIPPETLRRRETARILQFPLEINVYPPKPAPPAPSFAAIVINLASRRKALRRKLQRKPQLDELPWLPPLQPEPCRFNVPAEVNTFAVAAEICEFSVEKENDIFFVEAECDIFALDECGESSVIVCPTGPSIIAPTAQGYPSYRAPKAHRFDFDQIVSRHRHSQRKPTDQLAATPASPPIVVAMSDYQFSHDNGGFSDAVCWWDFNWIGEFMFREGNSGGFTTVADEWYVGHPISLFLGQTYELGLKSSTVVAGSGAQILYNTGNLLLNPGDWTTGFESTNLHSVRKTSLTGLGTVVVDTVYQIRLVAEPSIILEEFTIRATCIRS